MAFDARQECKPCVFRPVPFGSTLASLPPQATPVPNSLGPMPETTAVPRGALPALALAVLLASLGTSIANVGLPSLALAFDASFQQVQWIVLAYLLATTTLVVVAGRLGDRVGRRRLLLAGIALFALASLLCAAAPTLSALLAARALQGLGAAIMLALGLAIVADTTPRDRMGRAMGWLGTMSAVGTALGPALGGALVAAFAWPAIFLALVPPALAALVLAYRALPGDGPARAGAALPSLALVRNPALAAGFAASLLVSTVLMATLVVGPFHLSLALGLQPTAIGGVMSAGPLVAALSGLAAGQLVDRQGAAAMSLAGLLGMAIGTGLLALLPTRLGVAGYVVPLVLLTAAYALFQAANNTAVMGEAGGEQRGTVSGALTLSRNVGLIASASLMGAVFVLGSGTDDPSRASPEAVAEGMRITFAVATALVLLAFAGVASAQARARRAVRARA